MYILVTYVPEQSAEAVKKALFIAGAGQLGDYSQCCFSTKGIGQFLPNDCATPAIGKPQQLSYVDELRLEMVVVAESVKSVIQALKASHPYEEPAYHLLKTIDVDSL